MAIMMLIEEKKLALEDPISKYLDAPENWSAIRLRHLLTHTSGLGDYPESFSLQRDYTEDELLKMITSQSLVFAPGEKWSYSNLGYVELVLEHGGGWQGFASYIVRYPEDRLTVAVLCNRAGASASYIAKRIAGFYVPSVRPRLRTAIKPDPAILSSYAGEYRLEDRFTIKVSLAGDRLETMWRGEKIMLLPESETGFFQEDSDRTFRFVKDAGGKITSLIISVPEELVLRRVR